MVNEMGWIIFLGTSLADIPIIYTNTDRDLFLRNHNNIRYLISQGHMIDKTSFSFSNLSLIETNLCGCIGRSLSQMGLVPR
jgi:hypothetical protein